MTAGGVEVRCLGSGGAFSYGRYWSGFLLGGRVLLDCPPQTLVHLYRTGARVEEIDLVLLSHEHSDHVFGLDLLLLEAMEGRSAARRPRDRPLAIAGPPGIYQRMRELTPSRGRLPERDDPRVVWFEQDGAQSGGAFQWAGLAVECVEVEHAPKMTALGFRVRIDGRLVAYTGDTRMCDAVYALADGADLLITEGGGDRAHHHMEWPDVLALREALPPATRVLVTHYDPATAPDVSGIDGLTLAEDLATYEV